MDSSDIIVRIAEDSDKVFAGAISYETFISAKERGTGISERSPEFILDKIERGKAIMAVTKEGEWAGFCYLETWANGEFVSHSGMIVSYRFRHEGIAARLKQMIFTLSRERYPASKLFSITTGLAIMKLNSSLGFEPVTFDEIKVGAAFWEGCKSCVNVGILNNQHQHHCLCTAMLFSPKTLKQETAHV